MIGQGRPTTSLAPAAHPSRAILWLCGIALAQLVLLAAAPTARADEVALRLRIAWGGGGERIWQGVVGLSAGKFSELTPLGIEADEPGSIWLDGAQIRIRQPSLRAYDGIDVLVSAELDARLSIWLSNGQSENAKTVEIALRDLVTATHDTVLDDVGNRLFVSRSPGDRLRIQFDREHLVFAPGEMFSFQVQPLLIETGTAGLRLQARVTSNPGNERVWAQEYATGDEGTATSITIPVPQAEGVYELAIAAVPPSRIKKTLGLQKPLAERKIQFIVLDPKPAPQAGEPPNSKVLEINPVNPRWWERFANLPLFGGFRQGPLGNGDAAPWDHPTLGPMIQLGPGGTAPDISWEAYPLPINHPGQVHLLAIEYPSDVPQAMGISLLEPNAAGAVMPIGLDSGVFVSDDEAENPPRLLKHSFVFWPKTKTPLLLVTNRRSGSRAVYGKITVHSAPHSQFPVLALGRDNRSALPPAFPDDKRPKRLWAGYLDRPLVPENFGAPEVLDPQSYRSLDDWNTFHQGGIRLVKYLKHVGYNGLMLSVYADGSTIYPSRLVEPTPRYDTGVFFASGQDPRRKDSLELLMRLFAREGLVLIPALQFAAPLPELEALKRSGGPETTALEWVGADGKPWLASAAPRQGLAPYYNLLDPRVQQAMLNVVREIVARYANHESFGGLALQLSPDGYAQLLGEEWGYDDATMARFQRETGTSVPMSGPRRFAERARYLQGEGRDAWLTWRAGVVAGFHRQIEREIASRRPGAKLYLAGGTLLEDRHTQFRLRPTLPRHALLDEALKELGIHTQAYRADPGIVLLQPQLVRPSTGPLPAQAAKNEIYLSSEMDRLFAATAAHGNLFYHEPQKARLTSFDVNSPFGAAKTYTWLVSQLSPSDDRNRRRFVHALAVSDSPQMFDGGWLLPLGQEAALRDIVSVYRQLPGERFESVAGEIQPLTIRTLARDAATFVYLVNDSPWSVSVALQVDAPPNCTLEKVGESPGVGPLVRTAGLATWNVSLKPYDLVAARLSAPHAKLRNTIVSVPQEVRQSLERRIDDLVARVAASDSPQPLSVIENPSFEVPSKGEQIVGWTATASTGGRVALDPSQRHGGQQSVLLESAGQRVSITSAPFDPPDTGRLAVEVRLRASDAQPPPSLRIVVEGEMREGVFEPYGIIDRVGDTAPSRGGWARYSFPVDNVPSEGLSNLRVRLELLSAGQVWIDDVQVFDLWFNPAERLVLGTIVSLASVHLEKGQVADCARLLDGYWPQFLVANVSLTTANTPLARRPPPTPLPSTAPPKKPSMLDNIKSYFR